jgi:hypothetical protein
MAELKALADEDLQSTVLRLTLDLTVSVPEMKEVEDILDTLKGTEAANPRAGPFVYDRSKLRLVAGNGPPHPLPPVVRKTWGRLNEEARTSEEASRALVILQRLLFEVS